MIFLMLCFMAIAPLNVAWASKEINDNDALKSVENTQALFDINVGTAQKLELYLQVIQQTYDDLIRQKQSPDFIIAFRGASVRLITTKNWAFSDDDQASIKKAASLIRNLNDLGVQLEACSIATTLFKVDKMSILPEIKVVGNTFVSLIGYQTKGYALVPIH